MTTCSPSFGNVESAEKISEQFVRGNASEFVCVFIVVIGVPPQRRCSKECSFAAISEDSKHGGCAALPWHQDPLSGFAAIPSALGVCPILESGKGHYIRSHVSPIRALFDDLPDDCGFVHVVRHYRHCLQPESEDCYCGCAERGDSKVFKFHILSEFEIGSEELQQADRGNPLPPAILDLIGLHWCGIGCHILGVLG